MGGVPLERISLSATAAILLHGRPCDLTGGSAYNTGAAVGYIQLWDATAVADVVIGTTVAYKTLALSPGDNDDLTLGKGVFFSKGMVAASTTTPTGSTSVITHFFGIIE